jgi:hypothetical protein
VSVEQPLPSPEIENLMAESRVFPPDPAFTAQANATAALYEEADADFEAFWAKRARERIDLGARVIDIIFAGDGEAGEGEKIGERIAEDRAPAMADMHRSGRVGGDIFYVHRFAFADGALPIGALLQHHAEHARPEGRCKCQVDEAWAGDLDLLDMTIGSDQGRDALGQSPRQLAGGLGQHHGRVGGEVAVGGVLRRLERDALDARIVRHHPVMLELLDRGENAPVKPCKDVHGSSGKVSSRD